MKVHFNVKIYILIKYRVLFVRLSSFLEIMVLTSLMKKYLLVFTLNALYFFLIRLRMHSQSNQLESQAERAMLAFSAASCFCLAIAS